LRSNAADPTYPLIYVLPVEKRGRACYGDPHRILAEAQAAGRLGVTFAFPEFDETPWYADHPQGRVRQETELLQEIVPAVESQLDRIIQPRQRLLVGFSKSGWGALSLLMRQPHLFGFAGAWDAPFLTTRLGRWDTDTVFGDEATLEQYSLAHLCRTADASFRVACRIVVHGHCLFEADTDYAHRVLHEHGIPHRFRNDQVFPHMWHTGWLWPLLTELIQLYRENSELQ
jgi:hypothetical protein